MSRDHRLVVYGTLAPGRSNHHELSGLAGCWRNATVRGRLIAEGWGAELGYPGMVCADDAAPIAVQLFESADLPAHWARLDAFEGGDYQREPVTVEVDGAPIEAWIYAAAV